MCLEDREAIMFSGKMQKWNKFGIKQDRNFIITNMNFYHYKKKSKSPTPPTKLTYSFPTRRD